MDFSASQFSSGCESGWTRYLDQSSLSEYQFHRAGGMDEYRGKGEKMEKEEDLSLVSDASSGPSHYHEDDEESIHDDGFPLYSSTASEVARKNKKKKKAKAKESGRHRHCSNLDDTATSPALNFPKVTTHYGNEDSTMKNLWNFSQGNFSATQFEGKSAFQENFTFLKSFAEKPASEEQGGFHGRNWK